MEDKEWVVDIKDRCTYSGKEKEVDGQIIADIIDLAGKTPLVNQSTIIIISGDADIRPAVSKIAEKIVSIIGRLRYTCGSKDFPAA